MFGISYRGQNRLLFPPFFTFSRAHGPHYASSKRQKLTENQLAFALGRKSQTCSQRWFVKNSKAPLFGVGQPGLRPPDSHLPEEEKLHDG
jgi:hypothetical protein